eukprot:TRINITY_DN19398_c0_g1_i1.p1 TRINITY_DN19398_c0_g1~~TRINITY_DN19398_c0_g1_i1.p1  ORF type:complete len:499 (+),score=138.73 TRINITY_DN19398_c0_g1_i1:96-1592(+)
MSWAAPLDSARSSDEPQQRQLSGSSSNAQGLGSQMHASGLGGLARFGRSIGSAAFGEQTFQAMSDWGDDFERKYCDGSFVGALKNAPAKALPVAGKLGADLGTAASKALPAAGKLGADLGTAAIKLVEEAVGMQNEEKGIYLVDNTWLKANTERVAYRVSKRLDDYDTTGAAWGSTVTGVDEGDGWLRIGERYLPMRLQDHPVLTFQALVPAEEAEPAETQDGERRGSFDIAKSAAEALLGVGRTPSASSTAQATASDGLSGLVASDPAREPGSPLQTTASEPSVPGRSQWQELQEMKARLAEERERRRGRTGAMMRLGDACRELRAEIVASSVQLEDAEHVRRRARRDVDEEEKCLEELHTLHRQLQSQKAAQQAELRRFAVEAAKRERAAREANKEGAWAREGPETEALKDAKLALAEALGQMDQVRLEARGEIARLQEALEVAQAEHISLHKRLKGLKESPRPTAAGTAEADSVPAKGLRQGLWNMLRPGSRAAG